ncbi:MAG TPA: EAL domain-containing protein [Thermoanaerobaculia bacterium]|nr:EAL domain-containing protein [Thermoanaerobaculia bacterium]
MTQVLNIANYTFSPYAVPGFLTAVAMLILGLLVVQRTAERKAGVPFALLTLSVSVWLFCFSWMYCARLPEVAIFWARAAYLGIPFIPAAAYHFTVSLLRLGRNEKRLATIFWGVSAVFATAAFSGTAIVTSVHRYFWGYYPMLGWLALAYLVYLSFVLALTMRHYIVEYRRPQRDRHRRRIELFLIAFSTGYLGAFDYFPSFGIPLYPFGYLAIAGFIALAARAVWRYRLVDFSPEFAASQILETMQGSVLVLDLEGKIRVVNQAACEMLGYEEAELVGTGMGNIIESPLNIGRASDTLMRGGIIRDRAMIWRRKSGERAEVAVSGSMLRDDQGTPAGLVYVALDISDRKRAEQIEYQAYHDALTGLPNRIFFKNRVSFDLDQAEATHTTLCVLMLDLDGFKLINESFGHSVGDELLQAVSRRLRGCLRDHDAVARLGGDEFAILLLLRKEDDVSLVTNKILETIRRPFHLEGHELFVTTSIGIALHPTDGHDAETLLRNADNAMYAAKERGKNNYQISGPTLTERSRERLFLENSLRRALELEQFVLYYQPVIDFRSVQTVGVEALIRWNHPQSGLLSPHDFIEIAEEVRLIVPIGEWVLRTACTEARRWQLTTSPDLRVAVNLSVYQFQQRDLVGVVAQALDSSGLAANCLQLEITESVAMQNAEASVLILRELKDMGVLIAIDDFGTGYSSLSYLKRFPIDTVKLDQSFIRDMRKGSGDAAIVSAVIAMAHALNLKVVAEGVETEAQLLMLQEMDCDELQGFLASQPVPVADIEAFLRENQLPGLAATEDPRRALKLVPPPAKPRRGRR